MANLTFRGSASRGRQSSFDPFDVPDQTLKLQQETERTLSGMREVRSQNLQNRSEQLNALKEKNYKETQQRSENIKLKRNFDEAFHKAEMQHYETNIESARTKTLEADRKYQEMKKLAELIPKSIQAYAEFDQARWKGALESGKVLANQLGASGDVLISYTKAAEGLKFNDARLDEIIDKYFPNANNLQRRQLKNLRGYKKMGMRAVANQLVVENNYDAWLAANSKSKKYVNKAGNTLEEILSNPDLQVGNEARVLRARIEADFQKNYFMDDNPEFVKRYTQPHLDKKADYFNAELTETLNNNRARIDRQENIDAVKEYRALDPDGTQWVEDYVNSAGDAGRAHKWRTLSTVLSDMAASGELTEDELDKIKGTEITINGKVTTIGESKKELLKPVDKSIHERDNRNRTVHIEKKKNFSIQGIQLVEEMTAKNGRPLNSTEWTQIKNWFKGKGFSSYDMEKYAPWVKASENRESMEIETSRSFLDGLYNKGELKMAHLKFAHQSLWTDYSKKAIDGPNKIVDKAGIFSQLSKAIVADASKTAKSKFEINAEAQRVIDRAKLKTNQLLEPALIGQIGGNPTDIYQSIIDKEMKLLEANAPGTIYERATDADGNFIYGADGGFKNDHDPISILEGYKEAVKEKKDLTNVLTEHDNQRLVNYVNGVGRRPLFLDGMAAEDSNRTPFEMAELLTAAGVKGGKLEPKGHEGLLRVIPPANRKLITDRGSTAKTYLAVGSDPEQVDALLTSYICKDVANFSPDAPYDVVTSKNSGNGLDLATNVFGTTMDQVTIRSIVNAQTRGIISEAGAFKLNRNDLQRFVGTGMASPDDLFTPELQKLLYREKVDQSTSTIYANDNMAEPIPGCGQHWITSGKEQKGELDVETAAALSTRLDLTKIPSAVFNELILNQSKIEGGKAALEIAGKLTDGRIIQPLKRITK